MGYVPSVRGELLSLKHHMGIIPSLSLYIDYSGLYAAGTFPSLIGLLSEEIGEDILLYLGGVTGPVTQVESLPSETVAFANLPFPPSCNSIRQGRAFSSRPAGRRTIYHSGMFETHCRGSTRLLANAGRIKGCNA